MLKRLGPVLHTCLACDGRVSERRRWAQLDGPRFTHTYRAQWSNGACPTPPIVGAGRCPWYCRGVPGPLALVGDRTCSTRSRRAPDSGVLVEDRTHSDFPECAPTPTHRWAGRCWYPVRRRRQPSPMSGSVTSELSACCLGIKTEALFWRWIRRKRRVDSDILTRLACHGELGGLARQSRNRMLCGRVFSFASSSAPCVMEKMTSLWRSARRLRLVSHDVLDRRARRGEANGLDRGTYD
jgi:hypothetical protein